MAPQIPISREARADDPRADAERDDGTHEIAPDLADRRLVLANVVFVGSVRSLAALKPERVVTGHGCALHGPELRHGLDALAQDFEHVAVPDQGRYVETPARAEDGSAYRSP